MHKDTKKMPHVEYFLCVYKVTIPVIHYIISTTRANLAATRVYEPYIYNGCYITES